jgi:hypothetical protein
MRGFQALAAYNIPDRRVPTAWLYAVEPSSRTISPIRTATPDDRVHDHDTADRRLLLQPAWFRVGYERQASS